MILQKRFRVFGKKRLLELISFLCITVLLLVVTKVNGFGLATKIPELDTIENITVTGEYSILVDSEDFGTVLNLHKEAVTNKAFYTNYIRTYYNNGLTGTDFEVCYTLKNGKTLYRSYYIPNIKNGTGEENALRDAYAQFLDTPKYILAYHFTNTPNTITFIQGNIEYCIEDDYYYGSIDASQCKAIASALTKDIEAGNYDLRHLYDYESSIVYEKDYINIDMEFIAPAASHLMTTGAPVEVTDESEWFYCNITLNENCVYTLEALEALDLTLEDILAKE